MQPSGVSDAVLEKASSGREAPSSSSMRGWRRVPTGRIAWPSASAYSPRTRSQSSVCSSKRGHAAAAQPEVAA
jgi:hypothetical protein